jgi:hypothetical protein
MGIFTCLSRVHDHPNYLAIDSAVDRVSLFVSIGCDSLMLTREDFPMLVGNIWKIDKDFQRLTSITESTETELSGCSREDDNSWVGKMLKFVPIQSTTRF